MSDRRPVRIILKDQAMAEFKELKRLVAEQKEKGETNSEEMRLLKSIKQKIEVLRINPAYGDAVPHKLIPKTMDVSNLFRVSLTGYWRMLYTLAGNQLEIVAFILYIVDHRTYDGMFGYRKI